MLAAATPLAAQTLTLAEALRRAELAAFDNRIARANAGAEAARSGTALRGILPAARVEAGWMRTTDPVGVFGMNLRQRSITAADFNPGTLNDPAARGDLQTGLVVEVPLFNADAWLGRRAATRAGEAAQAMARWTSSSVGLDVTRAWFGTILATERVLTLEAASRAARDHVRAAEALQTAGLVTRSDVLLASVRAGEIESDLAGATADAALARSALAVLLGSPADTAFVLPASLPAPELVRALAALPVAAGTRADVDAARLGREAAGADRLRARSLLLPRLNGFARYDWHSSSSLAGGRPMWTAGVMAVWSPFSGGSELAESRVASGRLVAAQAAAEAAEAGAVLQVSRLHADLSVALQRLTIAELALTQSTEAHRLVARRYENGLATLVELLGAAATETQTRTRHSAARYDVIVAAAARLHGMGASLTPLGVLDQ